jgi:predicted transcriptional regulator
MTLNLSEKEMHALEKLSKEKDMSKTAVMRQALRVYQAISLRKDDWWKLIGPPDGCGCEGYD